MAQTLVIPNAQWRIWRAGGREAPPHRLTSRAADQSGDIAAVASAAGRAAHTQSHHAPRPPIVDFISRQNRTQIGRRQASQKVAGCGVFFRHRIRNND
jgi:hypothetical protein